MTLKKYFPEQVRDLKSLMVLARMTPLETMNRCNREQADEDDIRDAISDISAIHPFEVERLFILEMRDQIEKLSGSE